MKLLSRISTLLSLFWEDSGFNYHPFTYCQLHWVSVGPEIKTGCSELSSGITFVTAWSWMLLLYLSWPLDPAFVVPGCSSQPQRLLGTPTSLTSNKLAKYTCWIQFLISCDIFTSFIFKLYLYFNILFNVYKYTAYIFNTRLFPSLRSSINLAHMHSIFMRTFLFYANYIYTSHGFNFLKILSKSRG